MLKGKCKIQLKDVNNGLILFEEEHYNTVTPAIEKIFSSNLAGTLNPVSLCPLYSKLLGGVCLFDSTLATTDVFLPPKSTTKLTAHAGQDYDASYTTVDTKVGQPDGQLSVLIPNGFKWVWNWSNAQGNGTIASIALTHKDTGSYWNEELGANIMTNHFVPIEDVSNHIINPAEIKYTGDGATYNRVVNGYKIPLGFYEDLNHIVSVQVNENDVTIHISHFTGDGFWLWNNVGDVHDDRTYTFTPQPWQLGTWQALGICMFYMAYDQANKKLYFINCGDTDVYSDWYTPYNQSFQYNCVDLTTWGVTTGTVSCIGTLNDGKQARIYASSNPEQAIPYGNSDLSFYLRGSGVRTSDRNPSQVPIINGSIYIPIYWYRSGLGPIGNTTDCYMRINLSNTADQEIVKGFTSDESAGAGSVLLMDLGNGRLLNANSFGWVDEEGESVGQVINPNIVNYGGDNRFFSAVQLTDNPVQYFTGITNNNNLNVDTRRGVMLNKLFKATAFNLDTPVVKTAAMTMTVEYSLYQQEEEPENTENTEEESEQTE